MHTANIKIREYLQEVKNNGKSFNFLAQKVVGVTYRGWSFTRGSNCKALSLSGLAVTHGGLTVLPGANIGCLPLTQTTWVEILFINKKL